MGLELYYEKRDFRRTPEPKGKVARTNRRRFVVQEHHAEKLHFDFRLEMDGVLKSWSIPRGPSLDPAEKRLAVPTEDHPVEYLKFEGLIPEGNYGAGEHMKWDGGTYELVGDADALAQYEAGRLKFQLHGEKLRGEFSLVRMGHWRGQWLLIKSTDEFAEAGWQLQLRKPDDERGAAWLREREGQKQKQQKRASAEVEHKAVKRAQPSKDVETISAPKLFARRKLSGNVNVKIGKAVVALTNLDKVYWPEDNYTKGDLVKYYYEIAPYLSPYLKGRPLIMKRYPAGIGGGSFHQHDVNEAPEFIATAEIDVEEGHAVDYIVGGDRATLVYMANLAAIERHPWHSRIEQLDRPDWVVFDLDPENVDFEVVCEMAVSTRDVLEKLGLESYVKTSGSRGLHVYVPVKAVHDYDAAARFAELVARLVVRENPEVATIERSLKKRQHARIYIDHMQNARGKSVVAPYSVRPRPGAPVSAPLSWDEVKRRKVRPQDFNIKNIPARIARAGDLFKPVLNGKQTLDEALLELESIFSKRGRKSTRAGA
ncbi:MAG TPA: non-homologous end-joining DNA ligase [Pyrinomonadaceae bacterium]|jgi:bifunctional non-homologous end joining protein LigD|nr:non-homologous end-joining DNA ligase [Pyrinomonadaceae bacterium]